MERLLVIPYPKKVEIIEGTLDCSRINLVGKSEVVDDFVKFVVGQNLAQVGEGVSVKYAVDETLSIDKEGYILDISQDGINIKASDISGVKYAFSTLMQLMYNYNAKLVCCHIEDEPFLKYRGMLLDNGRYFFPVNEVLRYIDFCYLHKLNVLHWHLTEDQGWRIEIDKYPLLTEKGSKRSHTNFGIKSHSGFYTKDEIREVIKYANERNIEVIPEFDIPGHSQSAIACYPYLSCFNRKLAVATHWGVKHDPLCMGKESTFEWVFDILDEIIELFGDNTKYIHIGGDEVFRHRWNLCPDCKAVMEKYGLKDGEELQAYFMRRVSKYVADKGYIPIAWSGIKTKDGVSDDIVWQLWDEKIDDTEKNNNSNNVVNACENDRINDTYENKKAVNACENDKINNICENEKADSACENDRINDTYENEKADNACENDRINNTYENEKAVNACEDNKVKNARGYINSCSSATYIDLPYGMINLRTCQAFNPIPNSIPREKILGAELTLWTEYVPDFYTACKRLLPRSTALAEAMWCEGDKDYQDFENRLLPTLDFLKACGYKSVSLKCANPNKFRAFLQNAWFNRRLLHWQGLHNLIDDLVVTIKYKHK